MPLLGNEILRFGTEFSPFPILLCKIHTNGVQSSLFGRRYGVEIFLNRLHLLFVYIRIEA